MWHKKVTTVKRMIETIKTESKVRFNSLTMNRSTSTWVRWGPSSMHLQPHTYYLLITTVILCSYLQSANSDSTLPHQRISRQPLLLSMLSLDLCRAMEDCSHFVHSPLPHQPLTSVLHRSRLKSGCWLVIVLVYSVLHRSSWTLCLRIAH